MIENGVKVEVSRHKQPCGPLYFFFQHRQALVGLQRTGTLRERGGGGRGEGEGEWPVGEGGVSEGMEKTRKWWRGW